MAETTRSVYVYIYIYIYIERERYRYIITSWVIPGSIQIATFLHASIVLPHMFLSCRYNGNDKIPLSMDS